MKHRIQFKVNNQIFQLEVKDNYSLARLLRDLGFTSVKYSCERGECGICTVLVDGTPVKSCLMLAVEADGHEITTVEGLAKAGMLTPVQHAFIQHGAVQCGFCTPSFILVATALLKENPNPSKQEVIQAINGILCRCTGYKQIIEAILNLSKQD